MCHRTGYADFQHPAGANDRDRRFCRRPRVPDHAAFDKDFVIGGLRFVFFCVCGFPPSASPSPRTLSIRLLLILLYIKKTNVSLNGDSFVYDQFNLKDYASRVLSEPCSRGYGLVKQIRRAEAGATISLCLHVGRKTTIYDLYKVVDYGSFWAGVVRKVSAYFIPQLRENPKTPLAKRRNPDSAERMIRPGFLDIESRQNLIELARDGLAAHRLARRANALVLLDDGMSCEAIAKVLLLDDNTIRTWYRLYEEMGSRG